jgi:pantoate--beta-alanine ligase
VETIRTTAWMKEHVRAARAEGRTIALVPTMGALHAGHLSLVERARQECSEVIVSIFVNPKQFGPREDLTKYPRTLESDLAQLSAAGVHAVFAPEASEIYPPGFSTYVHVEGLSERLEGKTRPGHFRGVATVVMKLFATVQPDFAYFGRKDAQQARIIGQMARDLNLDPQIVLCPIVREPDGLALSSRNVYLDAQERRAATALVRALSAAREQLSRGERNAAALESTMHQVLAGEPLVRTDYAEVVDAESFEPAGRVTRTSYALLAAYVGKTRLIDNMLIEITAAPDTSEGTEAVVSL